MSEEQPMRDEDQSEAVRDRSTDAMKMNDALRSVYDAGAVRVPPWLALVAGLASVRPESMAEAVTWLGAHRDQLEDAYARGRSERLALAVLPPELCHRAELGYLDLARRDHGLRERYLFADLVGRRSFFQVAMYAISGVELSEREAQMLEEMAIVSLNADRQAWPMAVTRRVAGRGGACADAVVSGLAMMGAQVLAGRAAGHAARYFARAMAAKAAGRAVDDVVAETLAAREHVMGFGRPVVGPDERVPFMKRSIAGAGRAELPYAMLLCELEEAFARQKGLGPTAAAWAAAALCDFGMSPEVIEAVCNFWVSVTVFAQAVFSGERAATGGQRER